MPAAAEFRRELEEPEARAWRVFEAHPSPVLVVDPETLQFITANAAALAFYGYTAAEFRTLHVPDVHVADSMSIPAIIASSVAEKQIVPCRHRKKDGSEAEVENTVILATWGGAPASFVLVQDATARNEALRELAASERQHRPLFESNPNAMFVYDKQTSALLATNRVMQETYGYSEAEFRTKSLLDFRPVSQHGELLAELKVRPPGVRLRAPYRHLKSDGSFFDVEVTAYSITWGGRDARMCLVQDVTDRKRAETNLSEREARLQRAQRMAGLGDWERDMETGEVRWSDELFAILGLDPGAGLPQGGHPYQQMVHCEDVAAVAQLFAVAATEGTPSNHDHRIVRPDGEVRWVHLQTERQLDADQRPFRLIGTVLDITSRKNAERELAYNACYDALTGLPNQSQLRQLLEQRIAGSGGRQSSLAVVFIDLDGFKTVNDTLGHPSGDRLLQETAARLKSAVRSTDVVARMGGDEFVILLAGLPDAAAVTATAEKILARFAPVFELDGRQLHVTPSLGICVYPSDGDTAETLIRNADTAMYAAKEAGRDCFRFFAAEMHERASSRLRIEHDLHGAAERGELELLYQPIYSLSSGELLDAEALIRWNHPSSGLIPPAVFIPIAEQSGVISEVGEWVLRTACKDAQRWQRPGKELGVAVNVSARQLSDPNFAAVVASALAASGLKAHSLELELTETALAADPLRTQNVLEGLRSKGVRLAIDDFGTGYNSLLNLRHHNVDTLKIDRIFVTDIEESASDHAIAAAIVSAAHNLGIRVVAEGIEKPAHHAILAAMGCDDGQGYWYHRPMSAERMGRLVDGLSERSAAA